MKFISALLAGLTSASYDDTYEHTHVQRGEEIRFRDVELHYDEIEYNILTKVETEVRTRQIPITTTCTHDETKYRADGEVRYTTEYEIKYRPNDYYRHTWEPVQVFGY